MALQNIFAKQTEASLELHDELSESILLKEIAYFEGRLKEAYQDQGGVSGARQHVYRTLLNHRLSLLSEITDNVQSLSMMAR
jgi:hypothetical protein